jgi:hypothetical protein
MFGLARTNKGMARLDRRNMRPLAPVLPALGGFSVVGAQIAR